MKKTTCTKLIKCCKRRWNEGHTLDKLIDILAMPMTNW